MEGYFPFELKDLHPDGVVFSLVDKSNEIWIKGSSRPVDPKSESCSCECTQLVFWIPWIHPIFFFSFTAFKGQGHTLTKDEFLNKLPKSAVNKDGSVIPVRDGLRETLGMKQTKSSVHALPKEVIVNTPVQKLVAAGEYSFNGSCLVNQTLRGALH